MPKPKSKPKARRASHPYDPSPPSSPLPRKRTPQQRLAEVEAAILAEAEKREEAIINNGAGPRQTGHASVFSEWVARYAGQGAIHPETIALLRATWTYCTRYTANYMTAVTLDQMRKEMEAGRGATLLGTLERVMESQAGLLIARESK